MKDVLNSSPKNKQLHHENDVSQATVPVNNIQSTVMQDCNILRFPHPGKSGKHENS